MQGARLHEALDRVAGWRYLAAALLGVLGLLLNRPRVELLPGVGPEFLLGGGAALVASAWLGPGPGILTAFLALGERLARFDVLGAATLVYVVEAPAAWALRLKLRSLALSAIAFWVVAGWAFDVLVYWRLLALPRDFVALLFTKQVLNATLNGLVADVVILLAPRFPGASRPPAPMRTYTFDRIAVHVLGASLAVGLFVTRWSYESRLEALRGASQGLAREISTEVSSLLRERAATLETLARLVEMDLARGAPVPVERLDAVVRGHPEFLNVGVLDPDGWLLHMRPGTNAAGERIDTRRSLAHREYFRLARATRRSVYAPLILGDLRVRSAHGAEPVVIVAEPLLAEGGSFAGLVFAAMDAAVLGETLRAHARPGDSVTLADAKRNVIASLEPRLHPGMALGSFVPDLHVAEAGERLFRYSPPPDGSLESRYGIDVRQAAWITAEPAGWGVLVDRPWSPLYAEAARSSQLTLAAFLVTLVLLWWILSRLASLVTGAVEQVGQAATLVGAGDPAAADRLSPLARSPIEEVRDLGRRLGELREVVLQRQQAAEARLRAEEAIRRAERLESLGQLAGGVAHDFNNVLGVVSGAAELLLKRAGTDAAARERLDQILRAGERAAALTRQLLAFGRRQVLDARVVDANELLRDTVGLLRPLVGENVEVVFEPDEERAFARVDPHQLDRIVVNLAANARDAMPGGGRLTLRTGSATIGESGAPWDGELAPGEYVVVEVADTGHGMSAETRARAFEPFFTTKEPGKGTGLGLATVYGIAKQSGGSADIDTEPGRGTRVRIYLPRAEGAPAEALPAERVQAAVPSPAPHRPPPETTVLLVEDDDALRDVTASLLETLGYRVRVAASGEEAVDALAGGCCVDLVITDVVLTGMGGPEVARRARAMAPGAKVLFVSGYSEALASRGLGEGDALLAKPFTSGELAEAVRGLLDPPAGPDCATAAPN
ncbi:MAG: ATP-binding protein [Vicinamibacteria bacterium]